MTVINSNQHYGLVTKLLHWAIALLISVQYSLVYYKRHILPKDSELVGFLIADLHKPLGVVALCLVLFAIIWHLLNPRPTLPAAMATWQRFAATMTHALLYLSMLAMAGSGLIMTMAYGSVVNMFKIYQLPLLIEKNKELGKIAFNIHETASFVLLALIILHVLAAMEHHWIEKDNVCRRMLF